MKDEEIDLQSLSTCTNQTQPLVRITHADYDVTRSNLPEVSATGARLVMAGASKIPGNGSVKENGFLDRSLSRQTYKSQRSEKVSLIFNFFLFLCFGVRFGR